MTPTWTELTPPEQSKIRDQLARNLRREGPRTQSGLAQRFALSCEITGRALAALERDKRVEAKRLDNGVVLWTGVAL